MPRHLLVFIAGVRAGVLTQSDTGLRYLTMRLAKMCGIPSEEVSYQEFCGQPAVVITRYDRVVTKAGVRRIHQEDFCQALSVTPEKKYAEDGGPSTPDVLHVLAKTSEPMRSTASFAAMLFFNYLMGAPDAHAKNYSILYPRAGVSLLAPLYDVASGLPYDLTDRRPLRMAMSIGGENHLGFVDKTHVERFADMAALEREACLNLMANLCDRIVTFLPDAVAEAVEHGARGIDELASRLVPRVESHCRRTLQQL